MRISSRFVALAGATAILAAACGGSATPSAKSDLKIGVVTDVGTLDDKNFNEFSYQGAVKAAEALGAAAPQAIVTTASADYAKNLQTLIDQGYDVIVTIGFAIGADTAAAAKANPEVKFIGVDQGVCIDEQGNNDPTFGCKGDPAVLLPNYQGLVFKEDQPGYLAGVLAASVSKSGVVGAIGGTKTIPPVVRYIQGYYLGAKATNPNVEVKIGWVSDDLGKAFNDPAGGKQFAQQFLAANPGLDVLFQVAGKTGNGVLSAACEGSIYGIGVDVDQYLSYPDAKGCTISSAEKKLSNAVQQAIERIAAGTDKGGTIVNDAANEGIGLAPYHDLASVVTTEIQAKIDAALAGIKDGSIVTDTPLPEQYLQ